MKQYIIETLYVYFRKKYHQVNDEYTINYKSNNFIVSKHALLRYFERVEGYNLDKIQKKLTEGLADKIIKDGDGKYVINGVRVTVVRGTIVTVDTSRHNISFNSPHRDIKNNIKGFENIKVEK